MFNTVVAAKWNFKRIISIKNTASQKTNAVVQIELNSANFDYTKANANGSDVRFTIGNFKNNGLSYWIEQWNENGVSRIWVKIPKLKAKAELKIAMVYGNPSAQPVSNGASTFLFFDDFNSGDYKTKWTNVSIGQVEEKDGSLRLKEADGEDGIIAANFNVAGKMIIRTLYQRGNGDEHWTRAGIGGWNYFFCFGDHTNFAGTGTNWVMLYDFNSLTSLTAAPLVKAANKVITNQWRRATFWYDGQNLKGMQDDVTVEWPVASRESSKLSLRTLDNDAWDSFKYITVSPFDGAEPKVSIGGQQLN